MLHASDLLTLRINVLYFDSTFSGQPASKARTRMPAESYWSNLTGNRISRRRALVGGAGLGVGALALSMIGCGGSDSSSSSKSNAGDAGAKKSALVSEPKDTAKEGKQGGVWKHFARGDATHFDSLVSDTSQVVS